MSDSVGSVSVDVVPDARGWAEKLRAQIRDVTAKVNMDTTEANAKLDELVAKEDNAARTRRGRVVVDTDKSMVSRLDGFASKLGTLPALAIAAGAALVPLAGTLGGIVATLGAPLAIVGAGATLYGFLAGAAVKQTEAQQKKIAALQKAVESAKLSLSNAQASAATSASNSAATAQASAAASLKSAEATAAASIRAARQAEATATTAAGRQAARQRIAAAQRALAVREAATHTSLANRQSAIQASQSASVASAQRKVNQAVDAYRAALKGLSPEQSKFLDAQSKLKAGFQNFIDKTGPALLGPLTQGLGFLTRLLPSLQPVIDAFGASLKGLFDQMGRATQSRGFQSFIQQFSHQLGPDLASFGHIIGNLATGFGGLFLALDKHAGSGGMLDALDRITHNFSQWANSRAARHDVRQFLDYFHKVGPQVGHTIASVAHALKRIVEALAPLGPVVLAGISKAADGLSKIPIPVLTALAGAFAALVGVHKVGGFKLLANLPKGLRVGQNIASALTAGLIPEAASKYGKGVTPVYVTNAGFGGSGGGSGTGRVANFIEKHPVIAGSLGVAGVVTVAAASAFALWKAWQYESQPGRVDPGGKTPAQWAAYNRDRLNANTGGLGSEDNAAVRSVTDRADTLRAKLASASRQIDLIGPRADAAFGTLSRDIDRTSLKLAELHDPMLKARLDDTQAIRSLQALQRYRLHDKTLTIQVRQELERGVGPGGGMGRPTGAVFTGPIHVQPKDYQDFTQQMQQRHRRASLSGVNGG